MNPFKSFFLVLAVVVGFSTNGWAQQSVYSEPKKYELKPLLGQIYSFQFRVGQELTRMNVSAECHQEILMTAVRIAKEKGLRVYLLNGEYEKELTREGLKEFNQIVSAGCLKEYQMKIQQMVANAFSEVGKAMGEALVKPFTIE